MLECSTRALMVSRRSHASLEIKRVMKDGYISFHAPYDLQWTREIEECVVSVNLETKYWEYGKVGPSWAVNTASCIILISLTWWIGLNVFFQLTVML